MRAPWLAKSSVRGSKLAGSFDEPPSITSTASHLYGVSPAQQDKLGDGMLNAGNALAPDYNPGVTPTDDPEEIVRTVR